MENKTPPTQQDLVRIFMQYPGQPFITHLVSGPVEIKTINGVFLSNKTPGFWVVAGNEDIRFLILNCSILLKPLKDISDDDAIAVAAIGGRTEDDFSEGLPAIIKWGKSLAATLIEGYPEWKPIELQQTLDFLRSRGYALPYGQWSVDELVQCGIFKIIENGK